MDGKMLARLAAIIFVAFAITATAIEMIRDDDQPEPPRRQAIEPSTPDPLRQGQRRCQRLGEAAARDDDCLRVWAESRDRFLGVPSTFPAAPPPASNPNEGR